jgi:hypothetical protein
MQAGSMTHSELVLLCVNFPCGWELIWDNKKIAGQAKVASIVIRDKVQSHPWTGIGRSSGLRSY